MECMPAHKSHDANLHPTILQPDGLHKPETSHTYLLHLGNVPAATPGKSKHHNIPGHGDRLVPHHVRYRSPTSRPKMTGGSLTRRLASGTRPCTRPRQPS